ncbi:hypothetical protein ElyMa_001220000 [Elysia marginata]|uniref:Uncharacterized protein n=1 Tax=Elysia marginata TaxID=1093978 RepID=A0AAV4I7A7_9GAST|nr:hypothetical protein ElyMa_001220000 [Elysia marginata]
MVFSRAKISPLRASPSIPQQMAAARRPVAAVKCRLQTTLTEAPGAEELQVEVDSMRGVRRHKDYLFHEQIEGMLLRVPLVVVLLLPLLLVVVVVVVVVVIVVAAVIIVHI